MFGHPNFKRRERALGSTTKAQTNSTTKEHYLGGKENYFPSVTENLSIGYLLDFYFDEGRFD